MNNSISGGKVQTRWTTLRRNPHEVNFWGCPGRSRGSSFGEGAVVVLVTLQPTPLLRESADGAPAYHSFSLQDSAFGKNKSRIWEQNEDTKIEQKSNSIWLKKIRATPLEETKRLCALPPPFAGRVPTKSSFSKPDQAVLSDRWVTVERWERTPSVRTTDAGRTPGTAGRSASCPYRRKKTKYCTERRNDKRFWCCWIIC